jgi:hypothetical protein
MTKRRYPTKKERAAILLRQHGLCAWPGCTIELPAPGMQFDHANPLALSHDNSIENFQCLCGDHAHLKTNGRPSTSYGSDRHAIDKTKRLAAGGRQRRGPPIRSRSFRGWRTFSGDPVWKRQT